MRDSNIFNFGAFYLSHGHVCKTCVWFELCIYGPNHLLLLSIYDEFVFLLKSLQGNVPKRHTVHDLMEIYLLTIWSYIRDIFNCFSTLLRADDQAPSIVGLLCVQSDVFFATPSKGICKSGYNYKCEGSFTLKLSFHFDLLCTNVQIFITYHVLRM